MASRALLQGLRRQGGKNLPVAAAAAAVRRGVLGGWAPSAPTALLSSPSPRMFSEGRGNGGTGAAGLMLLSAGGSGCRCGAGGGYGGTAGAGLGAGVAGVAGAGCNCAQEIAKVRAESMAEIQRLLVLYTSLLEQNGKVLSTLSDIRFEAAGVHRQNAKAMAQLADLRIVIATREIQSNMNVLKLSYRIFFVGVSAVYGITNFMIPYVKENWKRDIIGGVLDAIDDSEKRRKAREEAEKNANKWGFLGF